jgi:methylamine dehydrogenase heavy chain
MTTFHRKPMIGRLGRLAAATLLVAAYPAFADVPKQLGSEATAQLLDETSILIAPPSNSKRVYVLDPGHFHMTSTVYSIDGKSTSLLGMTDAGKLPHVMPSSDGKFVAIASTMYSRVAAGKRDDYLQLIDPRTHNVLADIDIPEGRFLTGVLERLASLSSDDKHVLFQQFSPSPAVGMVDLEKKAFVKMIDVPDCYHIFPTPKQNFFMHCRDGSLLQVSYDDKGNAKQKNTKVFHPENEYLLNQPYYSNSTGRLAYSTYEGRIYQAKLSDSGAEFLKPFDVFTEKEKKEKWRPGGWQTVAYHKDRNELYLLADQREKWTHKLPSRFVFVVDGTTGKRLRKIALKHEIDSIAVSQDAEPYLYALSAEEKTLFTFDARTGKKLGELDELGRAPSMVFTMDK